VEVFFILSGYLITRILLNAVERRESHILPNFYIKRAVRILPIFFLTIGICLVMLPGFDYRYIAGFLGNYFFAFNPEPHPLRHFWSLAVEEQYYLVWPLMVLFLSGSRQKLGLLLIALCVLAVLIILFRDVVVATDLSRALIHRSVETRMLALCVGGLLAVYRVPNPNVFYLFTRGIAIVVFVMLMQQLSQAGLWPYMKSIKTFGFLGISLLLFLVAFNKTHMAGRVFEFKPLIDAGKVSYGLYVYLLPLFYYFGYSHMQVKGQVIPFDAAVMLVAVTILIALISWRYFEHPLMQYRRRFLGNRFVGESILRP
jgi:peptidoglycan/LPS O-acetylase OafA/YrhL